MIEMEEAKSYYDEESASYEKTFDMLYFRVYDAITWKYLEPYIPTSRQSLVLDAGGGTGRWSIRIAQRGCNVVLMDVSQGMLRVAAKRKREEGLGHQITLKIGSIETMGFADETFDVALCEQALFLFKEPSVALREINRVLKEKARLVVSAHNRYVQALTFSQLPKSEDIDRALKILLRKEYASMPKCKNVKIYTWTPFELRKMLEGNGFRVEKIIGKGVTMPLRISKELFTRRKYPKELFEKILQFELAACEEPDALALAGSLQAIACKDSSLASAP